MQRVLRIDVYVYFITNSDFTREAVETARKGTRIITLINGDKICDLVAKYNYYVEPVTTYRLKDFYSQVLKNVDTFCHIFSIEEIICYLKKNG